MNGSDIFALNNNSASGLKIGGNKVALFLLIFSILLSSASSLLFPSHVIFGLMAALIMLLAVLYLKIPGILILLYITSFSNLFLSDSVGLLIHFYNFVFGYLIFMALLYCGLSVTGSDSIKDYQKASGLLLLFSIIAIISMLSNGRYTVRAILETARYFTLPALLLLWCVYLNKLSHIKRTLKYIIFYSAVVAIYSYLLLFNIGLSRYIMVGLSSFHGVHTFFGNANSLAMDIGYSMPVILAFAIYGKSTKSRWFAGLSFFVMAIIWALCNSRSSYVFMFSAAVFLLFFLKKKGRVYVAFVAGLVCAWLIIDYLPIFKDLLRLEAGLSLRDDLWRAAIGMIKERPVFGFGPASYDDIKFLFLGPSAGRSLAGTSLGGAAHNLYLTKASEIGIIGLFVLLVFLFYIFYKLFSNYGYLRESEWFFLYAGSGAVIFGLIFRSFFEIGNLIGNARVSENIITFAFIAIIFKLPEVINKNARSPGQIAYE